MRAPSPAQRPGAVGHVVGTRGERASGVSKGQKPSGDTGLASEHESTSEPIVLSNRAASSPGWRVRRLGHGAPDERLSGAVEALAHAEVHVAFGPEPLE